MNAFDLDLHLLAQILVESAQRLVEQQHIRAEHQSAGESDALLLAARQFARIAAGETAEVNERERRAHTARDVLLRRRAHAQRKGDVPLDRHVREQGVVLEHEADVAVVGLPAGEVLALKLDRAGGRILEPCHHHQRRRLARSARAQQRDELAAADVDTDVIDGIAPAVI
jgi:hypothetical protein